MDKITEEKKMQVTFEVTKRTTFLRERAFYSRNSYGVKTVVLFYSLGTMNLLSIFMQSAMNLVYEPSYSQS